MAKKRRNRYWHEIEAERLQEERKDAAYALLALILALPVFYGMLVIF